MSFFNDVQGVFVNFLVFFITSYNLGVGLGDGESFNVIDFGAVGDGKTDDSNAFLDAWQALCMNASSPGATPTLQIPEKTFLLQPVDFKGPCKSSSVHIEVLGTVVAPPTACAWSDSSVDTWLGFKHVGNLFIDGQGQFDGQGSDWWKMAKKRDNKRPTSLRFNGCDGLRASNFTSINSPKHHFSIHNSNNVTLSYLKIIAPGDSPNTDGIDIVGSTYVNILNSFIGTGDDCVAINGGSSNIVIQGVQCGPGHGISVGSLGRDGANDTVEEVHVKDCVFNGSTNGARIKTWQGGKGYAKRITFENIKLISPKNPIIINQFYCDRGHNCQNEKSAVAVSHVTYRNITGTSTSEEAINFKCSASTPCTGITLDDVQITSSEDGKEVSASCSNVRGTYQETKPDVSCLSKKNLI